MEQQTKRFVPPDRDMELMDECVAGLASYAAQMAYEGLDTTHMRNYIHGLVGYWGLDSHREEVAHEKYLEPFDREVAKASGRGGILPRRRQRPDAPHSRLAAKTLAGLLRHVREVELAQGPREGKDEIVESLTLARDISGVWNTHSPGFDDALKRYEGKYHIVLPQELSLFQEL